MSYTSTDRFLNLLEYFIFWLDPSDEIFPINTGTEQLLENLTFKDNLFQSLFNLETTEDVFELAATEKKREVKVSLADDREKILKWEFVKIQKGVACIAADWDPLQEIVEKCRHENLIFKELLLNILPGYIADELIAKKAVHPKVYRHCTILFTDVVDFSKLAFHLDPVSLIRKLNSYFSLYDQIMDEYRIEKIKTIGDSYMCVSGIPMKKSSHSVDCCLSALKILYMLEEQRQPSWEIDGIDLNNWSIRLGIHTGPCISGVVGFKKYIFDIWGDSVNIASRMEKAGAPSRINISESAYEEVKGFFDCSFRGNQNVKNIGTINMYFLNRIKPEFSEDKCGFSPNLDFKRYYCETFRITEDNKDQKVYPKFIQDYLKSPTKGGKQ